MTEYSVDTTNQVFKVRIYSANKEGGPRTYLYHVNLIYLSPIELGLNAGRFGRFEQGVDFEHTVASTFTTNQQLLPEYMAERVDWISARTYAKWSLAIHLPHVGQANITWSFADHRDAVAFKLVWG